jgi:hypothetical protein
MMDRVLSETTLRESAESDKAVFEHELDELSASLFEEANRMVAVEKYARSVAEGKSQSLEERLRDTEGLMSAQAVQLRDLGGKLEAAEQERDRLRSLAEGDALEKTAAASAGPEDRKAVIHHRNNSSIYSVGSMPLSPPFQPRPPFDMSHPLPSLMTDILPFHEFVSFVKYLRHLRVQTLSATHHHPPSSPSKQSASATEFYSVNGNSSNYNNNTHPPTPEQLAALHALAPLSTHVSQPFVKRSIEEDSDPTMRLDIAPGLNWLSRREVGKAVIEGSLVIEPAFGSTASAAAGQGRCALCGISVFGEVSAPMVREETTRQSMRKWVGGVGNWSGFALGSGANSASPSRSGSATPPPPPPSTTTTTHRRQSGPSSTTTNDSVPSSLHVFRTSDVATSRYPLCSLYCLPRLRAACEFWAFVRALERGLLLDERFGVGGPAAAAPRSSVGGSKKQNNGLIGGLLRRTSSSLDEQRSHTPSTPAVPPPSPVPRQEVVAAVEQTTTETEVEGGAAEQTTETKAEGGETEVESSAAEQASSVDNTTTTPSIPTPSEGGGENENERSPSTPRAGSPTAATTTAEAAAAAAPSSSSSSEHLPPPPAPVDGQPESSSSSSSEPPEVQPPSTSDSTSSSDSTSATTASQTTPQQPGEKPPAPPLPPRSDARNNAKIASADVQLASSSDESSSESTTTQPDGSRPVTPQQRPDPPPRPPPRHPRTPARQQQQTTGSHSRAVSHESGTATTAAASSSSREWEERCWAEIVKLKEVMFWTRIAAKLQQDHDVTAAGALSRLSVH